MLDMASPSKQDHKLPLRPIPGDYGLPVIGPIKDRIDFFYNQGGDNFMINKIRKYNSTVFRTNFPPGPLISNPKVICLADAVSFPVLFDTSIVEKRNVLVGTYFPSVSFTGGHRVCAYLDPSEPKHTSLKSVILSHLASLHDKFIPLFRACMNDLFIKLEDDLANKKEAYFNDISDNMSFRFTFRLLCNGKEPSETVIGPEGNKKVDRWVLLQIAPTGPLRVLPSLLEDFLMHTFMYPSFLVKSDYRKIYDAVYESGGSFLDEAEAKSGISREEACHNLVFLLGFNAYGGMKLLFPNLVQWVGLAGEDLHRRLANEIRTVVSGDGVTFASLEKMSLTKSVVYESLRMEPPIPFQYGTAKEDTVVRSHEAAFEIKKGEMIVGYQPLAMKDPRVFENPDRFVGERFMGEEGERLLKYVYWSNGRESDDPTVENKQCPGKDLVVLLGRLLLVEIFLRYDTFTVKDGVFFLNSAPTITSVTKKKL